MLLVLVHNFFVSLCADSDDDDDEEPAGRISEAGPAIWKEKMLALAEDSFRRGAPVSLEKLVYEADLNGTDQEDSQVRFFFPRRRISYFHFLALFLIGVAPHVHSVFSHFSKSH